MKITHFTATDTALLIIPVPTDVAYNFEG